MRKFIAVLQTIASESSKPKTHYLDINLNTTVGEILQWECIIKPYGRTYIEINSIDTTKPITVYDDENHDYIKQSIEEI